jgi:hypothetical protein
MTNSERSKKMTHVIGLFSRDLDYNRSFRALRAAGLNPEKLRLVNREQLVGDILGCGSARVVAIYAGVGGLLGFLIYGISALLASWCQCNLFQFNQRVQVVTLIGGILAGIFVGVSLGIFFGISMLEEVTSIYWEGRRKDGKVLDVKAKRKQVDQIKNVLQSDGAYEVRFI